MRHPSHTLKTKEPWLAPEHQSVVGRQEEKRKYRKAYRQEDRLEIEDQKEGA